MCFLLSLCVGNTCSKERQESQCQKFTTPILENQNWWRQQIACFIAKTVRLVVSYSARKNTVITFPSFQNDIFGDSALMATAHWNQLLLYHPSGWYMQCSSLWMTMREYPRLQRWFHFLATKSVEIRRFKAFIYWSIHCSINPIQGISNESNLRVTPFVRLTRSLITDDLRNSFEQALVEYYHSFYGSLECLKSKSNKIKE